jgi:hypothetical protein
MAKTRSNPLAILGQLITYAAFAVFIGYFSYSPSYQHFNPDLALIKLSFSHAGARRVACRQRTPDELAALAPNMRRAMACSRERIDLLVELLVDDQVLYRATLRPAGLARDGASAVYRRFPIAPGSHVVTARLRDSVRDQGFDYEHSGVVDLLPRQNFVIDFKPALGGFVFL